VDGNIHRLFCRLLALYAPATLPVLIKKLWSTAQELVDSLETDGSRAGDLNQALMELGSQICKPTNPDCGNCPLRSGCNAYSEASRTKSLFGSQRVRTYQRILTCSCLLLHLLRRKKQPLVTFAFHLPTQSAFSRLQ
jgi:adenine-specific DNA glycosylase